MSSAADPTRSGHSLLLRSLILLGLIAFGLFLLGRAGLLGEALQGDRSSISYVIVGAYVLATLHWLVLATRLSGERQRLERLESKLHADTLETVALTEEGVELEDGGECWGQGDLASHLGHVLRRRGRSTGDATTLLDALGETLANRHAPGHFISDVLLKLGLLGTMVGFILMLRPVAEISAAEAGRARELLQAMSGGMAVALYTTIAGLVTSTLLKLQYRMLDSSAQDLHSRVAVVTDALMSPGTNESGP